MFKRLSLLLLLASLLAPSVFAQFPRLTGFTPARGGPGTLVAVLGSNLTAATEVRVGRGSATILERYVDGVVVIIGPDATTGPISVYTAVGQDVSVASFQVAPRITGFERVLPEPQTPEGRFRGVPGNRVAVYGANFSDPSDPNFRLGVAFGGVPAVVDLAAETNLLVTIPEGAVTGPITVTNNAGAIVSTSDFYLQPYIASFSPSHARVGDVVTLTGTSLKGTTSVLFGTVPAVPTLVTPTNVVVPVPAIAASAPILLTSPGGTYVTFSNLVLLPKIDGFQPAGGAPGTVVTVTGSGLAGTLGIEFGGSRSVLLTNLSPTSVTAVVPSGATSGPLVLWTANGTNSAASPFLVAPSISGYTPVRALPGATVTINGRNLTGATGVTFAGTPATFTVLDNARIQTVVPVGAVSGPIRVTHPGGSATGPVFQVGGNEPVVDAFQPAGGPPGTQVQVFGINFTGASSVRFGGVPANELSVVNDGSILTRVPAAAVSGPVTVVTADGTGTSAAEFFVGTDADLSVAVSTASPGGVVGQGKALEVTVSNAGPLPATAVVVSVDLEAGLDPVSVDVDTGTFEVIGAAVTWRAGNLASGATVRARLTVQPAVFGTLEVTASVRSDTPDDNASNDQSVLSIPVEAPVLSIAVLDGGVLRLSWPAAPAGLVLEASGNPLTGFWQSVDGTPETVGAERQLEMPASGEARYFRLRQGVGAAAAVGSR